jgi:hypothetical protein
MSIDPARKLMLTNLFILVFLAAIVGIVPIALTFHGILAVDSIEVNQTTGTAENQSGSVTLETLEKYIAVVAGIAEIIIVFLLWKTVKDFAELAKVSRLQTQVRFRPWIGPSGNIQHVRDDSENKKKQYAISIKNFGEVPSTAVTAFSVCSESLPNRESLKSPDVERFNLGPLLPNMEKRYWIFIDTALMENAEQGTSGLFVVIYFSYKFAGGKSAYGMISQYDRKSGVFIHRDMWLE